MSKTNVMDLTTVCQSFPRVSGHQILRENMLDTIDRMFEDDAQLIIVTGVEGIGKTTLLTQFAKRHPNNTFSLFIRPTSPLGYDPAYLRMDLYNQLHWTLYKEELRATEEIDDTFVRMRIFDLQKRARLGKFYFMLDGLDDIPEKLAQFREDILDLLPPLSSSDFYFLLTSNINTFSPSRLRGVSYRYFQLPMFSLDETSRYLEDVVSDSMAKEEIHRTCRGFPGYLASARRILEADSDIDRFLQEMPKKVPDLFEIEWRKVNGNIEQLNILGILAYDRKRHTLGDLSRILNINFSQIESLVQELSFLTIDPNNQEISFVSESFRRFADSRLSYLKEEVNNYLINDLLRDPEGDNALTFLPDYLEQAGKLEELLDYLSPDRFRKMVEYSQSLSPVKQKANLGIATSQKLHREGDLMRFTIQKSTITELANAEVWRSEIEAKMALNNYSAALALAQSAELIEDRLHLLAIIARIKYERTQFIEPELIEQIRQLYKQIDPIALGERAVDIAADLIYSNPDIATELVEKATSSNIGEEISDRAFAKLSVATMTIDREQAHSLDILNNLRAKIQNPGVRRFSVSASLLLGNYSAQEVIMEVEKLDNTSDRLSLLREWLLTNRRREDAVEIVEYALRLTIRTTEYSPSARDFREIAAPLPFITDKNKSRKLVESFDSQKGTIEETGPTVDYVRLQIILAETESKYTFENARNRIIETYLYISYIEDLSIKSECISRLISFIDRVDINNIIEVKDNLQTILGRDLEESMAHLINTTADHYHILRSIIRVLAKTRRDLALAWTQALNTEDRRDLMLSDLIGVLVRMSHEKLDLAFIESIIDKIALPYIRDKVVLDVIEQIPNDADTLKSLITEVIPFINRINRIVDNEDRCQAFGIAYTLLMNSSVEVYAGLATNILKHLKSAWEAIDVGWNKINVGFKIAESFAMVSPEIAQEYMNASEKLREEITLDTSTNATTYLLNIHLAIRAFSGLLPKNIDKELDLERLARLIDRIPSNGHRAILWTELALHFQISKRYVECKRIVNECIKPLLDNISDNDLGTRTAVLILVAPALYNAHKLTALEEISKLPRYYKDAAYAEICEYLFHKKIPNEPYEVLREHDFGLEYDEIVDICEILNLIEFDVLICGLIERIANCVVIGRNKGRFTRHQQGDIGDRLGKIVVDKLPNTSYIKHEGYKILAKAYIARIQRADKQTWIELLNNARCIPNLADCVFVLGTLAVLMPREASDYRKILEEAKQLIEKIPVGLERMQCYKSFASLMLAIDLDMSKDYLELALKTKTEGNGSRRQQIQRSIIDTAYRIDSNFAASLASSLDDDPARASLLHRIDVQKVKEKMENQTSTNNNLVLSKKDYPDAAWMALGALNAKRITTVRFDHTYDFIQVASDLPLSQSYPILSWVIENAVRRFAQNDTANLLLRPIFEATLLSSALGDAMVFRSTKHVKLAKEAAGKYLESTELLIRPGNRDKALQFLQAWFENEVRDYIKICDPYFGLEDLEVLKLLNSVNPNCKVFILTSAKHQNQQKIQLPWQKAYRDYWIAHVSDQFPPDTEIVIVGTRTSGDTPIHDRWWISNGTGIRMGTSYNSLGAKSSEISLIPLNEVKAYEAEMNQYLQRNKREFNGDRLVYDLFTL